jgi:CheY-like chemotaxis protein
VAVSTGVADRSVLLVEDDHALAASLRYSLEREGFRVSGSGDGAEAIETIRRDRPMLVLLDLVLPGMTGFDVCRLIRKESNVLILILTCRGVGGRPRDRARAGRRRLHDEAVLGDRARLARAGDDPAGGDRRRTGGADAAAFRTGRDGPGPSQGDRASGSPPHSSAIRNSRVSSRSSTR